MGLVHSLRPDLFNWQQTNRSNPASNVTNALGMAEKFMGIPALLDPALLLGGNPDEKSVMTYVVNFLMYEQENRDRLAMLSPREDPAQKQLEEQQRQLAEQKRQMEELQRQKALLAQQQQLMAQQQQLAALEEQKRQLQMMQQAKVLIF